MFWMRRGSSYLTYPEAGAGVMESGACSCLRRVSISGSGAIGFSDICFSSGKGLVRIKSFNAALSKMMLDLRGCGLETVSAGVVGASAAGVLIGAATGDSFGAGVGEGLGVGVGIGVGLGLSVGVGFGVNVGEGDGVGECIGVGVRVSVGEVGIPENISEGLILMTSCECAAPRSMQMIIMANKGVFILPYLVLPFPRIVRDIGFRT